MRRIALHPYLLLMMLAFAGVASGCESAKAPPPREYTLYSPYAGMKTLAVAPVINQSGSRDFDTLTVSDTVFGELQQVQGLNVLPVNKTLAAMQRLGMRTIDSPQAAQALAEAMGADGLVVSAVTAYDPYRPPVVGMVMQLYTTRVLEGRTEPQARQVSGATLPTAGELQAASQQPVAHVAAIFNAGNQAVLQELRDFARGRTNYESALQEDRYLADSDAYTRFVSHAMVRRLMEVERVRLSGR